MEFPILYGESHYAEYHVDPVCGACDTSTRREEPEAFRLKGPRGEFGPAYDRYARQIAAEAGPPMSSSSKSSSILRIQFRPPPGQVEGFSMTFVCTGSKDLVIECYLVVFDHMIERVIEHEQVLLSHRTIAEMALPGLSFERVSTLSALGGGALGWSMLFRCCSKNKYGKSACKPLVPSHTDSGGSFTEEVDQARCEVLELTRELGIVVPYSHVKLPCSKSSMMLMIAREARCWLVESKRLGSQCNYLLYSA
ncbi:hypothetical protein FOZ63_030928 [Perkinsus olseni]|uniref:Uncharacterized protein n=1 Tax=Perkinsus olseni TaxID=32597 RepID=A0A7J6RU50_PEROL|nr:hypothetical protein FOZ63_030928 [Perkinsus olseni]KAF4724033.1 hypothetical protein FOZ62_029282 [Perkinsus olseni]